MKSMSAKIQGMRDGVTLLQTMADRLADDERPATVSRTIRSIVAAVAIQADLIADLVSAHERHANMSSDADGSQRS